MNMKKATVLFLSLALALSVTACGKKDPDPTQNPDPTQGQTETNNPEKEVTKIALLLPYIGDQSYFDTTYRGKDLLVAEYGDAIQFDLVEMGTDSANWETAHRQAAEAGYDIIISGNWQYEGAMLAVAAEYPDIKYLNFDYSDPAANSLPNVYAITYAANECGYLAGLVAGVKTKSNVVGGVGGMDNNGIRQFMAGYFQGINDINPDCKVIMTYVNDFQDTVKAKEIAQNMINEGADVIWGCAGGAGNGVFAACAENEGVWAIGVDTDQYVSMSGQPELANTILTSALKNCDVGVFNGVKAIIEGTAEYGTQHILGYAENGAALAENDYYLENMTEDELAKVKEYADKILSGETKVVDELVTPGVYDEYLAKVQK